MFACFFLRRNECQLRDFARFPIKSLGEQLFFPPLPRASSAAAPRSPARCNASAQRGAPQPADSPLPPAHHPVSLPSALALPGRNRAAPRGRRWRPGTPHTPHCRDPVLTAAPPPAAAARAAGSAPGGCRRRGARRSGRTRGSGRRRGPPAAAGVAPVGRWTRRWAWRVRSRYPRPSRTDRSPASPSPSARVAVPAHAPEPPPRREHGEGSGRREKKVKERGWGARRTASHSANFAAPQPAPARPGEPRAPRGPPRPQPPPPAM